MLSYTSIDLMIFTTGTIINQITRDTARNTTNAQPLMKAKKLAGNIFFSSFVSFKI